MLYHYRHISVPHSVLSLGGRWVRPRPIIGVTVIGPSESRLREGLLDTGADDTIFPQSLATILGIDLRNAPLGQAATATLAKVPLRYAQVSLRITDGKEQREWSAWVGFTSARLHYPLLASLVFSSFSPPPFTATASKLS